MVTRRGAPSTVVLPKADIGVRDVLSELVAVHSLCMVCVRSRLACDVNTVEAHFCC